MINNFYQKNITEVVCDSLNISMNTHTLSYFIGSCFSENLYESFKNKYLNCKSSPFGNIYNPKSLGSSLNRLINCKLIEESECILVDGLYQHFDFYTHSGNKKIELFLQGVNGGIQDAHASLLKANILVITLGTSYLYEKDNRPVNNCHKLPKNEFTRRVLTLDEIAESLIIPLKKLQEENRDIKIIFTISPVRHLRDNPKENSYSKALLRVAVNIILENITSAYYFPSYEILLDELRDYRWYKPDLTHPNNQAVEYIIEKFINSAGSEELDDYIKRIDKLNNMLGHKIINKDSSSTNIFFDKLNRTIDQLKKDYPHLNNLKKIKSSQYL
ncbi:MAG: GSCFA domain-containing protein [Spirochaetaceae bacterium]